LPGNPVVKSLTDEAGKFSLADVPAGANIPLVIVSGKWRRQITISNVAQCTDNPVDATLTSLPKSMDDTPPGTKRVDIPKIALSTGSADSLECLIRRLGIADKEIGTDGGAQRIHLYSDNGSAGKGVARFGTGFPGGTGNFADSTTLWNDVNKMKTYDIVILSCEGGQYPNTKPQPAMDALKAYADFGGRVFASHWHNIWIGGAFTAGGNPRPQVWSTIAQWADAGNINGPDVIDEANNPKGPSFATWMLNVMGSPTRDQIPLQAGTGRATCTSVDLGKAERWTYAQGTMHPQNFQFTTPNEAAPDQRCGKVVFSDMHVSGGPMPGDYPASCGGTLTLSPQEKALAFMFFDLASCVGSVF
jgi:hypothetical protein